MTATDHVAATTDPEPRVVPVPSGAVRCSNADRERISGLLHEAAGDGRLTMEETEERLGQTYAARYHHELDTLTADLAAPSPVGWALVFATARRQILGDLAVLLGRAPGTRARRIGTLLVALAVLLFLAAAAFLMMHGIIADGHEFGGHEFGNPFEGD
jgi:Domain of unknown function (DUF1707)